MKKYLTIVASALLMFAGANLYAQSAAQESLDKAKATLNDAQKHYDKVSKIENRKIDASKDKIADLKLKIDKDNLAINEANALIKQKQQTLKLKKDAYNAEKKALAADGGLSKADKMQLKEREGEVKAIAGDIKNDQQTVKALKGSISDKKNAIKREQNAINRSKAEISAAKKELSAAKQGVKDGKKAVSAEKKAAAAEAKVAAAEQKAAKAKADAADAAASAAAAETKQAAKESEIAANAAAQQAQAKADAAEAKAVAAAAEVAVAEKELAKAEADKAAAEADKAVAEASAKFIADAFAGADAQLRVLVAEAEAGDTVRIPMSLLPDGSVKYVPTTSWVSGFPAGSFWYMYQYTGDPFWAGHARKFTEALSEIQHFTDHHDIGFMINNSYGNGLRLVDSLAYKDVIVNAAKSLCTRFRPGAGVIQSWEANPEKDWTCPVIIDNMMNLELLFNAFALSGDTTFVKVALSHADKTIENHFRPDFSSWHVVDYNPETGEVRHKQTHQGFSDDSAWSRGQAWGLYGFAAAYRWSGLQKYLDQAEGIAAFIMNNPNLPEDGVPYWDYNAPEIPLAPRDASAGAIMASGLYDLYGFTKKAEYKALADKIVAALASPAYTAEAGSNHGFVLLHSVTSFPAGKEIDQPLNYADYYYLEALLRKKAVENL